MQCPVNRDALRLICVVRKIAIITNMHRGRDTKFISTEIDARFDEFSQNEIRGEKKSLLSKFYNFCKSVIKKTKIIDH